MDKLFPHVLNNSPCKQGCDQCCHYNVSISALEVKYIENENNIIRTESKSNISDFHGVACPFLLNGSCSIYSTRPFVCRRHHSMGRTSRWCDIEISNDYEFLRLEFSEVNKSYEHIVNDSGLKERHDIRQQFTL